MLRTSTSFVTLVIVSLCELACDNQSGLGIRGGSGGQSVAGSGGQSVSGSGGQFVIGSGGTAGAGGVGGSQSGSGGLSGSGGCIPPPCALLTCPYGYAPSSSPCGCGQCAPAPDAGAGGAGQGGAVGSGGTSSGGVGGTTDAGVKDASVDSSPDLHVCGPLCDIYCVYGNVLDNAGCPTCQCKAAPTCPTGSHAVTCPGTTACALDCSDYQRGADGCQLCACRTPATCTPLGAGACIYCPFGYRSGPGGCLTCSCADPPMGCAANASDAGA
jgi:hypothetical protein